jgi:hypothetical protein
MTMANKLKKLLANMSQEELLAQWEDLDSREIQSPFIKTFLEKTLWAGNIFSSNPQKR